MKWNGNNAMLMLGVARARLSMEGTWQWMKEQMLARLQPNGILSLNEGDHHFNSFGFYSENFSCSGAITELLLQSVDDIIRIFPAWPINMDASFRDLRAQGGFLVSALQKDSRIEEIEILSTSGGLLRMVSPWPNVKLKRGTRKSWENILPGEEGIVSFETAKGEVYILSENSPS
jgi:hypothetical protein